MDTRRVDELKNRATTVKTANQDGVNTALKVGQLLYDMIDYDGEQSAAINSLESKTKNLQNQIDDIVDGGGGETRDDFTVDLFNSKMPVGTNNEGIAANWSNSALVQVFHNSTPLTYADTTAPEVGYFGYSIGAVTRSDEKSAVTYGVPEAVKEGATVKVNISRVSSFSGVNAYIPITVYLPNGTTRSLSITVYGVEAGEAGKFIDLYVSAKVIRTTYNEDIVSPEIIKMGVTYGTETFYSSSDGSDSSAESKGFTFEYEYDHSGIRIPHAGDIYVDKEHSLLTIYMYMNGQLIDSEDVPYIKDGKPGEGGRGIDHTITYYKANATKTAPEITQVDATDPANTAWSEEKPFLYCRDWVVYSNEEEDWLNAAYLKDIWTKGKDAVTYDLIPSPAAVKFYVNQETNILTPDSYTVTCKGRQISGEESEDFSPEHPADSPDGKYHIYYKLAYADGSYSAAVLATEAILIPKTSNPNIVSVYYYLASDQSLNYTIKEVAVPVNRDGLKGESGGGSTGQSGKFYYYGGTWGYNPVLDVNDYQTPYVFEERKNKYFMYIGKSETIDTSVYPSDDTTNWKEIKYNKFSMADAMFTDYAHLGGLIINRDWIISQYGSVNGTTSKAYTSFDPVAFMTALFGEGSIGVITQDGATLPNSQLFQVKQGCTLYVKGNGTTQLAKIRDEYPNFFKFDNSAEIPIDYYVTTGDAVTVNNTTATAITITSAGIYFFLGGNLSDIKIKTTNTPANAFIPNYAVDLRSGFVYQNNGYVSGTLNVSVLYQKWQRVAVGTIDPQNGCAIQLGGYTTLDEQPTVYLPDASKYNFVTLTIIGAVGLASRNFAGFPKISTTGDDMIWANKTHSDDDLNHTWKAVSLAWNKTFKFYSSNSVWFIDGDESKCTFYDS